MSEPTEINGLFLHRVDARPLLQAGVGADRCVFCQMGVPRIPAGERAEGPMPNKYYCVIWRDDDAPIEGHYWQAFATRGEAEAYARRMRAEYQERQRQADPWLTRKRLPRFVIQVLRPVGETEGARMLWALNRSPV
jgi:hypothetical protein